MLKNKYKVLNYGNFIILFLNLILFLKNDLLFKFISICIFSYDALCHHLEDSKEKRALVIQTLESCKLEERTVSIFFTLIFLYSFIHSFFHSINQSICLFNLFVNFFNNLDYEYNSKYCTYT